MKMPIRKRRSVAADRSATDTSRRAGLRSRRPASTPVVLSAVAGVLAIATSLAGIVRPATYARETAAWATQAIGQDIANLPVAGMLLGAAVLVRRGCAWARSIWLGGLLYFIYAFAIYAFTVHFNVLFLAYVAVLGLAFYALVVALTTHDLIDVTAPMRNRPHHEGAGNLLVAVGVMFGGLWLAEIVPHLLANSVPPGLGDTGLATNPVHVLDLAFVLPAMVLTGFLLRRQHPWGLLMGAPLLVFAATMGLAILVLFARSAMQGLPVAMPVAVAVAMIVVGAGAYAWLLLRKPTAPPRVEPRATGEVVRA